MRYKNSFYNICVEKNNNEKVIYNTRTGAIATVSKMDIKEFDDVLELPNSSSGSIFTF